MLHSIIYSFWGALFLAVSLLAGDKANNSLDQFDGAVAVVFYEQEGDADFLTSAMPLDCIDSDTKKSIEHSVAAGDYIFCHDYAYCYKQSISPYAPIAQGILFLGTTCWDDVNNFYYPYHGALSGRISSLECEDWFVAYEPLLNDVSSSDRFRLNSETFIAEVGLDIAVYQCSLSRYSQACTLDYLGSMQDNQALIGAALEAGDYYFAIHERWVPEESDGGVLFFTPQRAFFICPRDQRGLIEIYVKNRCSEFFLEDIKQLKALPEPVEKPVQRKKRKKKGW